MKLALLVSGLLVLGALPVMAQISGDIDNDGRVTQTDLRALEQYLGGAGLLQDDQIKRADLNGDGAVDNRDRQSLRTQLGLDPGRSFDTQVGTDQRDRPLRASTNTNRYDLSIDQVVPEWVRGTWRFRSQVVENGGTNFDGGPQEEQISLPGDLSGLYQSYKVATGERLDRLCWQVDEYGDARFAFTEQLRDSSGAVFASTARITHRGSGRAEISIRTEVLEPGQGGGRRRMGGLLGGLLGGLFGGGMPAGAGLRRGEYYVRAGDMTREPGSERQRLPQVDLASLRCR